jgi:undecaprenyl-diphosphatase
MIALTLLQQLMEWDRELLIWLNSFHVDWLDPIMYWTSQTMFWLPLYLFLLWMMIKDFKKDWWIPLIGIAVTILLADQITATLMKPYFMRLRPSQEPTLQGIVHLVLDRSGEIYRGGVYGFASSHAANTFATATFYTLLLRPRHRWITWLFLWAVCMTYTRIYLGAHYPGDILVGGIVGVGSAFAGFKVFKVIEERVSERRKNS